MHVNLIKLCVGAESVADLDAWQAKRRAQTADGLPRHITRMWPRRAEEVLAGGSLYWVIKGAVLARQRVLRLDEVAAAEGPARCGLVLERRVTRTKALPRRHFQGWRYLAPEDAPPDLPGRRTDDDDLPPRLSAALEELGVR